MLFAIFLVVDVFVISFAFLKKKKMNEKKSLLVIFMLVYYHCWKI